MSNSSVTAQLSNSSVTVDFLWQAQQFGDLGVLLFVAGAVFGDLGVSLFVAAAAFGDVGVSFFVAGTVLLLGEIWVDSRVAKCCNFQYKMRLRSAKSNLGERAGAR